MKSGLRAPTENPDCEAGAIVHSPVGQDTAAEMRLRRNGRCGGECAECRNKRLQTKLAVNQPGDRFEQEADHMADSVIRGGKQAPVLSNCSLGALQRDQPNTSSASTSAPPIVHEVLEGIRTAARFFDARLYGAALRSRLRQRARAFRRTRGGFRPLGQRTRLYGGARHCLQRRRVCAR